MNTQNMDLAIEILRGVRDAGLLFDYCSWVGDLPNVLLEDPRLLTKDRLIKCGTSACALGWIAADPRTEFEFEVDSFTPSFAYPTYLGYQGHKAAAQWLDIPIKVADYIFTEAECFIDRKYNGEDVTVDDVLYLLEYYRENEKLPPMCY